MITPIVFGLTVGLGLWLLLVGARPRPKDLKVLLLRLEEPNTGQHHAGFSETAFGRVATKVGGDVTPQLAQDLTILDRTVADHARAKLTNAALFAVFPIAGWLMFSVASGAVLAPAWLGLAVIGCAWLGWLVTEQITHQRAQGRRDEFRTSLVTYLQLVAILLAGGAGTNEALTKVTRFGSSAGFDTIEEALTEARVRGESPWNAFSAVAARKGLTELDELAGAVQLAGSSGARVRATLLTKANSLRQTDLARAQAEAAAASESMGVPIGVMMSGFVLLIGFPAVMTILSI